MLWPFSLVAYADRLNNLHVDMNGKTPEIKLLDTIGSTTGLSNFHTFGWMLVYKALVDEVLPNGILELVSEYISVTLHLMLEALHWL